MNRITFVGVAVLAALTSSYAVTNFAPPATPPVADGLLGVAFAQKADVAPPVPEKSIIDQDAPYYEACAREGLNASECVGRLIWFKASAGNDRFHTYTFQQRVGVLVDWYRVLRTDQRDDRFYAWGIINDPACCKPGDPQCPKAGGNLRLRLVRRGRCVVEVCRQAGLCRPCLRPHGRAARSR
jgi:hypothetical protein